jgi:hypothetical protein
MSGWDILPFVICRVDFIFRSAVLTSIFVKLNAAAETNRKNDLLFHRNKELRMRDTRLGTVLKEPRGAPTR